MHILKHRITSCQILQFFSAKDDCCGLRHTSVSLPLPLRLKWPEVTERRPLLSYLAVVLGDSLLGQRDNQKPLGKDSPSAVALGYCTVSEELRAPGHPSGLTRWLATEQRSEGGSSPTEAETGRGRA
jgi:hypothetical protein